MLDSTQIFDGTLPSTGVAITTTRQSTNILDLLTARDIGTDDMIGIHVLTTAAFTSTVSTTLTVTFEVCDTTNGTYLTLLSTPAIPKAQLIANINLFEVVLPKNQLLNGTTGIIAAPCRYIALRYTVATGPFDTGSVMAWIAPREDRNAFRAYPRNYTTYVAAGEI